MPAQCHVCPSPTGDGAPLCRDCMRLLRDELGATTWLATELETTYLRQGRFGQQASTARSATKPLPWDDRASRMAVELNATLNAWALELARHDEHPQDPLNPVPAHSTAAVGRWLARNLVALRTHPEAGLAHQQLTGTIRRARAVVDRPPDLLAYGVCDAELSAGVRCVGFLYAPAGRAEITCRKCGATHRAADRTEWMLSYVRARWATGTEISTYLRAAGIKITSDAVRKMGSEHRIPVQREEGSNGREIRLYRFADVLDAMANRYQRRAKVS